MFVKLSPSEVYMGSTWEPIKHVVFFVISGVWQPLDKLLLYEKDQSEHSFKFLLSSLHKTVIQIE